MTVPRSRPRFFWGLATLLGLSSLVAAVGPPPAKAPVAADHARSMAAARELFARSVGPALKASCLKCHGDEKTRGGLDLVTREALLKGGEHGAVVTLGKGAQSKLYRMAAGLDEPHMPPKGGTKLTREQLADVAKWIDLGAAYDRPLLVRAAKKPKAMVVTAEDRNFWSFRPLARPAVPAVKHTSWARNVIDRFVLAEMETRGLSPSAEADARTLMRRATFDLVGLPPAPEDLEAFVADRRPGAYERLVERLLSSPHHGERWARHWLDVVRWAESHGFEHDYDRPHAWPYRDFVIKALNADLPYDTFTRWQLAGDEIAPDEALALTATGFLGAGVHSTQITANTVEKERYDELDDIVRTMGTAMLGLTVGCARCHDHKYDPIPTRDYYRLVSTFTTTVRSDQDVVVDQKEAKAARERYAAEEKRLSGALAKHERDELPRRLGQWLMGRKKGEGLSAWAVVDPKSSKSKGGATFARQPDGSLLVGGKSPKVEVYTFVVETEAVGITAVRVEALAHATLAKGGPGRAPNGNFALSDFSLTAAPRQGGQAEAVKFTGARATFEQAGLPVKAAIDGDAKSAWAVDPRFGKDHAAVFDLAKPIGFAGGTVLTFTLRFNTNVNHAIGRPRLSISTEASPPAVAGEGVPAEVRAALAKLDGGGKVEEAERKSLLAWYRGRDAEWLRLSGELAALRKRGPAVPLIKAMICSEGVPAVRLHSQGDDFLKVTHFLNRGDPNQKGDVVTQSFPQVLMRSANGEKKWQESPPAGWRTTYQRRSLSNWIVDVDEGAGHLLARVMVNRLWQHHFGRGLVATASDFGLQGERPTHPELLDWLASELVRSGWSLKHIHRLIVTSATYRQATATDRGKAAVDGDNRYLWRMVPRRLEAEAIRDSLLAVAGQLDGRMFGPGTLKADHPRRSIYFFVKRSELSPMMVLFDAPDGTVGIEARTNTTIAPQALLLMNNPVVRRAAAALGGRMATGDVVRRGYALALGREPSGEELAEGAAFLREQEAAYRAEGKADAAGLARTDFAQVLLGLNEFVYVD